MIRLAIIIAGGGLLLAGAETLVHDGEASAFSSEALVVSLGDRIRLGHAPVGCRVTRLEGHGRRPYLECRRAGSLKGTYGAFFSGKDVFIARFLGSREARIVFRASHEGSAKRCG
jgi:hypothetical protein